MTTTAGDRATYAEVLAVGEFRGLLLSRVLTITGTSLRMLAVSVLVLAATGSPLMAGLAFGIGFLPQVVGGMTLLALTDRLRPRRALVLGDLLEAATAGAIALVPLPAWAVLTLLGAVAVVTPVFSAAASGLVPSLLTGDRYVLGRSLLVLASAGSQIAGLAVGGVALALLSPRGALLVVVALQLAAGLLTRLLLADHGPRSTDRRGGTLAATWSGNRALLGDRAVRGQLLAQTVPPALMTGAEGMVVAYAAQAHLLPGSAGWLLAAVPVGMGLGHAAVGRLAAPRARERLVRPLLLVVAGPLLLFVLQPPLVPAAALLLVAATGLSYELGLQRRFLAVVPESSRGQAFGLVGTALMFGQGVGPVAFGALGSAASPSAAIAAAGAAVLGSVLLLGRHLRPQQATQPADNAGAVPAAHP